MRDTILARGQVEIKKNGELIYSGSNVVVTVGYQLVATLVGATGTKPSHMAFGDSQVPTTVGMTALQGTEFERVGFDSTVVTGANITYTATFGTGLVSAAICNEVGLFNAATAGTMLARFLTTTFTINPSDTVVVTWTVSFGE